MRNKPTCNKPTSKKMAIASYFNQQPVLQATASAVALACTAEALKHTSHTNWTLPSMLKHLRLPGWLSAASQSSLVRHTTAALLRHSLMLRHQHQPMHNTQTHIEAPFPPNTNTNKQQAQKTLCTHTTGKLSLCAPGRLYPRCCLAQCSPSQTKPLALWPARRPKPCPHST